MAQKNTNTDFKYDLLIEWSKIAKEQLSNTEFIKGTTYAYGSEIATLRLYKYFTKYGTDMFENNQGYSENLKTFYFSRTKKH
tara:strand:- start:382 stop:627 length:246 start_codon:yes stop_codon:yes gene_type:complete